MVENLSALIDTVQKNCTIADARHANAMAQLLHQRIAGIPGVRIMFPTESNAVFAELPIPAIEALRAKGWRFYTFIGAGGCRFMCSWDLQPETVEALAAHADAVDTLRQFSREVKTGKAAFTQTVTSPDGVRKKTSTGSFEFSRPNRFRFAYSKPFEQLIVSDGSKVWLHDIDLNQVSVRLLDQALGGTPAALLASMAACASLPQPLHVMLGVPFTPAADVAATTQWRGEDAAFVVEGRVTQFMLDGPSYELTRRIEIPLGGATIAIHDRVENIGHAPAPFMAETRAAHGAGELLLAQFRAPSAGSGGGQVRRMGRVMQVGPPSPLSLCSAGSLWVRVFPSLVGSGPRSSPTTFAAAVANLPITSRIRSREPRRFSPSGFRTSASQGWPRLRSRSVMNWLRARGFLLFAAVWQRCCNF